MRTIHAVLLSVGALASTALFAQPAMDRDGNGSVSWSEFEAASAKQAAERFARLDANADGELSREELGAGRQPRGHRGPRLAAVDTDGDGAWSLAELEAARPGFDPERFQRLDRNGDGLITPDEKPRRGARHRGLEPAPQD